MQKLIYFCTNINEEPTFLISTNDPEKVYIFDFESNQIILKKLDNGQYFNKNSLSTSDRTQCSYISSIKPAKCLSQFYISNTDGLFSIYDRRLRLDINPAVHFYSHNYPILNSLVLNDKVILSDTIGDIIILQ